MSAMRETRFLPKEGNPTEGVVSVTEGEARVTVAVRTFDVSLSVKHAREFAAAIYRTARRVERRNEAKSIAKAIVPAKDAA